MKKLILLIIIFNFSVFADKLVIDDTLTVEEYFEFKKKQSQAKGKLYEGAYNFIGKLIDVGVGPGCRVKMEKPDEEVYLKVCENITENKENIKYKNNQEDFSKKILDEFTSKGYDSNSVKGVVKAISDTPSLCKKIMSSSEDSMAKAKYIADALKEESKRTVVKRESSCSSNNHKSLCNGLLEFNEIDNELFKLNTIGNVKSEYGKHYYSLPVAGDCKCARGLNRSLNKNFPSAKNEDRLEKIVKLINKRIKDKVKEKIQQDFELAVEDMVSEGVDPKSLKGCNKAYRYLKRKDVLSDSFEKIIQRNSVYTPPNQQIEGKTVSCGTYKKADYIKLSHSRYDNTTLKELLPDTYKAIYSLKFALNNKDLQPCLAEAIPGFKDQSLLDFVDNLSSISFPKIDQLKNCKEKDMFKGYKRSWMAKDATINFMADLSVASQVSPMLRQFSKLPIESSLLTNEWLGKAGNPNDTNLSIKKLKESKENIAELQCKHLEDKARKMKSLDKAHISFRKNRDGAKESSDNQKIDLSNNDLLTNAEMATIVNEAYMKTDFSDPLDKVAFYQYTSESYCNMLPYSGSRNDGPMKMTQTIHKLSSLLPSHKVAKMNTSPGNKMLCGSRYFSPFHEWAKGKCLGDPQSLAERLHDPILKDGLKSMNEEYGYPIEETVQSQSSSNDITGTKPDPSSSSTPLFSSAPGDNISSTKALADFNRESTTLPYSTKDYISASSDLAKNEREKADIKNEFSKIASKSNLSESDKQKLNSLEERFKKLESENSRLRNQIASMAREKDSQASKSQSPSQSRSTNLRSNNTADFQSAKDVLNNSLSNNKQVLSQASAGSIASLSGRQLASLAYQVAGNNELIEPVRIKVDQPVSSEFESLINIIKGNNALDDQVRQAIIQKRPIIISDGEKEIEIEYGSEKYIRIAKEYKLEIDKVVETAKEKGGRSIASEIHKNYQELLNNSMNFISN